MSRLWVVRSVAVVLLSLTAAQRAQAQAGAGDKVAAEALFRQGLALMEDKKFAEACPKLAESQRLDAGVGTLLHLASCFEKNGQTASAWATFREAAGAATLGGQAARAKVASERALLLEPTLVHLTIEVPPSADVPGLEIRRGGGVISRALFGSRIPVDPGDVLVTAQAPGKKEWKTIVKVSKTTTVTVPTLENDTQAPAAATPAVAPPPPRASETPKEGRTAPPARAEAPRYRVAAYVAGAAGVTSLAAGVFFGLSAQSTYKDRKAECKDGNLCTQRGVDLTAETRSQATLSTVFTAVGVVGIGAGVGLYLLGGKKDASGSLVVSPDVGQSRGGLLVAGVLP